VKRLSIRSRLTLTFAAAMAVVLAAAGLLLYDHVGSSLDRTVDQGLRARAADLTALVGQADSALGESTARGPGVAQVLDLRGRVVDGTPGYPVPLLAGAELARAKHRSVVIGRAGTMRLFALPVFAQDRHLVIVVGAPRSLLLGAPVALLFVSLIGYLVAGAALRPVERMRAQAAAISASSLSERLTVPPTRDEVSRLGETLNALLERIETALERERTFVADASHELRTPLALLQAEIELALDRPRSATELQAALASAGEEADRLSQLSGDLLLLARADRGSLPITRSVIDLDDLLEGIAARFGRRATAAGRRIEVAGAGLRVSADALRLEQALGNLVENALRHGEGRIRISARAGEDGAVELAVEDEGKGFPPGFAAHAFERFSRASRSRTTPGAGLGLSIVASIASAHEGIAEIRRAGVGLWLPGAVVDARTVPAAAVRRRA
jgi:two-component system OmpR family sensor kinase